jgi:ribonuclease HII
MPKIKHDRLQFERELWQQGILLVAGVDEAGRGPLAGPVVAAAVMFERVWLEAAASDTLRELNDSKQLTETQREKYFEILTRNSSIHCAIAEVDAQTIDRINILQATHRAMALALEKLSPQPAHVLVDGRPVKSIHQPSTALVKGDARSYSIAAASVLAKVTRDRQMLEYDRQFPGYGFAIHKGYGTPQHLAAIGMLGPCAIHRRSFAPIRQEEPKLSGF